MTQFCLTCGAPPTKPVWLPEANVLSSLFASNDVPLESHIPLIHDIISDGEAELQKLEVMLARLISRRDEIADQVRRHRNVLSSVRRVPPELICDIFALTMLDGDSDPWHLSHICRTWRALALSYPPLWSLITVPSTGRTPLPAIRAQLLRSANGPLDIHWSLTSNSDVDSELLALLIPHSNRWHSLSLLRGIFMDNLHDALNWLAPLKGHLAQLQKLKAVDLYGLVIPDILSTASNLRQVILTDRNFSPSPDSAMIPWRQITHYWGTYDLERQRDILRHAENLLECLMGFPSMLSPQTNNIDAITLPHLRRLALETPRFLSSLTTPVLEDLYFFHCLPSDTPLLLPFLHRSTCTLQRLTLLHSFVDSAVISVLRVLPRLTYLRLEYARSGNAFDFDWINSMFILGAPSDICPALTSFVFGYIGGNRIPWGLFFDMARSRSRYQECRLEHLYLYNNRDLPVMDDLAAGIEMLRDDGIDAALLKGYGPSLEKNLGFL
ncbi:hypothetical protein K438DRAFT_1161991 [Mycena galopus ATCC 62051]|nr:hypothetical protein K438DRAFT_1161991 [Mycena galopus ATCC 62051]